MVRVEVAPAILNWAITRSGRPRAEFERAFPKLHVWLAGQAKPTLRQLEEFARTAHAPVGYLFLSEPPQERLPLADLRSAPREATERPSADLLETIYTCQLRQDWYREFLRESGAQPLDFVGSVKPGQDIREVAAAIRRGLAFDIEQRARLKTWSDALRQFRLQAEKLGILVMASGIVGNNTRRPLRPEEFRGFTLADELAPLIFINAADTKAAQMFTLAHELAHVWLGKSVLSDADARSEPSPELERWCNQVAAELLVPMAALRDELAGARAPLEEAQRLAHRFKVSTLVILRRMHDAGALKRDEFEQEYRAQLDRLRSHPQRSEDGGDFYATLEVRVGRRFARAVVASTLEGRTLFRDAYRLLGISREATFRKVAEKLGFAP